MSRAILYAANTLPQTVAVNGTINFGNIVRRYGCGINMSGGNVVVNGSGYYEVDTNITYNGTGTGTATIQLYQNGVAIPGATLSVTTVDDIINQVSIPAVFRIKCCCDSTITAVVTGISIDILNAAIEVIKE